MPSPAKDVTALTPAPCKKRKERGTPGLGGDKQFRIYTAEKGRPPAEAQSQYKNWVYCSFAYSALAAFRIGMSWSAAFHVVKKF